MGPVPGEGAALFLSASGLTAPPALCPALVPGYWRSVFGPPRPGRPCFALQCNLCFCWKPPSCLSTTFTKFIFRGLGLRGVPRARPGNKHRAISAQSE